MRFHVFVEKSKSPLLAVKLRKWTNCLYSTVDYYAHGRKVARHEPVQHYEMIAVRQEDKQERLLPIISDSPSAAAKSPLAAYARPEGDEPPDLIIPPSASQESLEHTSDVASHLLNPSGPWHLKFNLKTPDCNSGIHFTNREHGARIVILHRLKTTLRVAAGVFEPTSDPKERPKLFDIIIETPIHLLSVSVSYPGLYALS